MQFFFNLKSQTEERDFLSAWWFSGAWWGARARARASPETVCIAQQRAPQALFFHHCGGSLDWLK